MLSAAASRAARKAALTLARAWFFPTGDAVTANPVVVGDTVYAGSWDGNFYALNLTEQLGVEESGGVLRIGLAHYATAEEVDRLVEVLRKLAAE